MHNRVARYVTFSSIHVQIDLVNSTMAELVRSVRLIPSTMDQRDDVTQLVPSDGGDYVYALTAQQVNTSSQPSMLQPAIV